MELAIKPTGRFLNQKIYISSSRVGLCSEEAVMVVRVVQLPGNTP